MSQSELNGAANEINNALNTPRLKGFSFRTTWSALDTNFNLLNSAKAMADAKGLAFAPRFMAGRHTPARVFNAGAAYLVKDGTNEKFPMPFLDGGAPNAIFEQEYDAFVAKLAQWCRANGVREMHMSWHAKEWAELYRGPEVQAIPGHSQITWDNACKRLIDIALKYAGPDLAVEFPFSGHGALTTSAVNFADHVVSKIGPWDDRFFCQSNGWGNSGDWGAPNSQTEAAFDEVWTRSIYRGEQSIQPQDFNWTNLFAMLYQNNATYCEIYTPSFNNSQPHKAMLVQEISKFADYVEGLYADPTGVRPSWTEFK